MEETRFDHLAIAFDALTTRRVTLGALLGGALARVGLGDAAAKNGNKGGAKKGVGAAKKKKKKQCPVCKTRMQGKCKPVTGPLCTPSGGGVGTCQNGVCVAGDPQCANGWTNCNGVCKDLQTDQGNCGVCGHQCLFGSTCCSGDCTITLIDEANCGACGTTCGGGELCQNGSCCLANGAICSSDAACCSNDCDLTNPNDLFMVCQP